MALRLYNTMTNRKEDFTPLNPPKVGMYVCGVTVYDYSHVGHARPTIYFDVIFRYLKYSGYDVTYVRNFTDIDDKIIKRALELGITTTELTDKYIQAFNEDMDSLGLLHPDVEPYCTHYVPQMIEFIGSLIEKGHAYATESGDVYYRVDSFKGYGKLSGKNLEELEAGARVDVSDQKESPLDFALWKASKPGEPKWESPWGEGRPGWHIECSVMSTNNLGESFDIHGGGKDLIFPHHENEIAQSEASTGKPYARYWIHNGFINMPAEDGSGQVKMSKSLGNFLTIRDVLDAFDPEALKFLMLSTHYRKDVLFSEDRLNQSQKRVTYLYKTLEEMDRYLAEHSADGGNPIDAEKIAAIPEQFQISMDDDFNTPRAIGGLSGFFKLANDLLTAPGDHSAADIAATLAAIRAQLIPLFEVLGLLQRTPDEYLGDMTGRELKRLGIGVEEIEALLEQRTKAREAKDWVESDRLRDVLAEKGILVKDSKEGTVWSVKP